MFFLQSIHFLSDIFVSSVLNHVPSKISSYGRAKAHGYTTLIKEKVQITDNNMHLFKKQI